MTIDHKIILNEVKDYMFIALGLAIYTVASAIPVITQPMIIDMKSCPSPMSLNGKPLSCFGMMSCANRSMK